jgi:predicted permease
MPTLLLHNVGVDIALWTLGMLILAGRLGRRWWLGVLNPMVIAILLALLLKFTGGWASLKDHAMPAIKLVSLLADCAIPLSLLLSGATIADVWREADFREGWGVLWSSAVLRLGLIPAIFVGLTLLIPLDLPLKHVIAIQAAMPAAVFPIILARHYGGDPPTAVRDARVAHYAHVRKWATQALRLQA